MLDQFPSSVCPLIAGFGFDTTSGQVQTNLSTGAPRFELFTTDVTPAYYLPFNLDETRYRIFSDFYHNTLVRGSKWFTATLILNDPASPQVMEVHFLNTLNPRQQGRRWTFTMQAVVRNPSFADDSDYLNSLDDLLKEYGSIEKLNEFLDALHIYTNEYLPTFNQ